MSNAPVKSGLSSGSPSRGDDADDITSLTLTVDHHEQAGFGTHAQHDEPVFGIGMFTIEELHCKVVKKDGLSLLERNLMLLSVGSVLGRVPFETHPYIVFI
jgi:hypothetical protein